LYRIRLFVSTFSLQNDTLKQDTHPVSHLSHPPHKRQKMRQTDSHKNVLWKDRLKSPTMLV